MTDSDVLERLPFLVRELWQDRPPTPHPADSPQVSLDRATNKPALIPACVGTVF